VSAATFSGRQLKMLEMFADNGLDGYISYIDAHAFDQRPFRSMLIRRWISYRPGRGFHITREGRDALYHLRDARITRNEHMITHPLTKYFDSIAYGLEGKPKAKRTRLRVVKGSAA
jgi:hypothetical protein